MFLISGIFGLLGRFLRWKYSGVVIALWIIYAVITGVVKHGLPF